MTRLPAGIAASVVSLFCYVGSLHAGGFHVTPSGSAAGDGSIANPWDLQTALNHPSLVKPGDTIWVHEGTYEGNFTSRLNGTASRPIIVRNYQEGRATVQDVNGGTVLNFLGSYTWLWGLEVTSVAGDSWNVAGVPMGGPGQKLINMVIHDCLGNGISSFAAAPGAEVYGCLGYYNGRQTWQANYAYGLYIQNMPGNGRKTIRENIFPYNWSMGIHAYTQQSDIDSMTFEGNVVYNSGGFWRSSEWNWNVMIGSGEQVASGNEYRSNYTYFGDHGVHTGGRNILGWTTPATGLTVVDNYWVSPAGEGLQMHTSDTPEMRGNVVVGSTSGFSPGAFAENSYYRTWPERGDDIIVRRNAYEAKRANIVVYNWDKSGTVNVDVSQVLQVGDSYVVRDALNYYGSPVVTGSYTGGTISIPMTGLTVASPRGKPAAMPVHTGPDFAAFILVGPNSDPVQPPSGTLAADPDTLPPAGGTATLSWTSNNATSASIQPGIGEVPLSGSIEVNLVESTTFTLTLKNDADSVTYAAGVVVSDEPPPDTLRSPLGTFDAAPDTLPPAGGTAVLNWTSEYATSASIQPGIGEVPLSGSMELHLVQSTDFTLTLKNDADSVTYTATVVVSVEPPPDTVRSPQGTFNAAPDTLSHAGKTAVLSWTSEYATSASIQPGIGEVPLHGSMELHLVVSTTFSLTLKGEADSVTYTATVVVSDHAAKGERDVTSSGMPISQVTDPCGIGSKTMDVVQNGITPAPGCTDPLEQYDTYNPSRPRTFDWIGLQFPASYLFTRVIFQEGLEYASGGYFESVVIQVHSNGEWKDVLDLVCDPPYQGANGISYETHDLTFLPTMGDGIRVAGIPGGDTSFVSVAEIRALALPETPASVNDASLPAGFCLSQNYPNPFNPSTRIAYTLPNAATVSLKVYDVLGQEIATLAEGREEPGRHEVDFTAADLSGGVYFCVLRAGGSTDVRRMVYLR